jgi:hypothetical protein
MISVFRDRLASAHPYIWHQLNTMAMLWQAETWVMQHVTSTYENDGDRLFSTLAAL